MWLLRIASKRQNKYIYVLTVLPNKNDATFIPLLCHKTLQLDYFVDNKRVPINSCCLQLVK